MKIALMTLGAVALVAGLVAAVIAISTGTAGVRGAAGAHRQKESTQNRVFSQARFEDAYQAIQKDRANIAAAKAAVEADPTGINKTNVTGAVQVCNTDVAAYNADSRKYLLRDFKSAGLPQTIDQEVCK